MEHSGMVPLVTGRRGPTRAQLQLLSRVFSGQVCVATGNTGEWHHIDGNPVNNSTAGNFVTVDSDLNKDIERVFRAPRGVACDLRIEVQPLSLARRGELLRDQWHMGRAYGAFRLASFNSRIVGGKRLEPMHTDALMYSSNALRCARHSLEYELIEDVLTRDVIPGLNIITPRSVAPDLCLRIASECTSYLIDSGDLLAAHPYIDRMVELETEATDVEVRAGVLRRKAYDLMLGEGPDATRMAKAVDMLERTTQGGRTSAQTRATVVEGRLWSLVFSGQYDHAIRLGEERLGRRIRELERDLQPGTENTNINRRGEAVTVLAESLLALGIAAASVERQRSERASRWFRLAKLLYVRGGAAITSRLEQFWSTTHVQGIIARHDAIFVPHLLERRVLPASTRDIALQTLRLLFPE